MCRIFENAVNCCALQHTAKHHNKLPHTTLQETARDCKRLQETARDCKRLQETATDCNRLQQTTFCSFAGCALTQKLSPPHLFSKLYVYVCDMIHSCVWHDQFMCVTWPLHVCDMTPSCVWHDPFMCVTWPIHVCDMTHSCAWHDPFMCVTWPIHVRDMTHSCVWHDPFMQIREYILFYRALLQKRPIILRSLLIVATPYECVLPCWCGMGWLRLVGSLMLYVSFAKEPYETDDILQKRPIILRSLLIVATQYVRHDSFICETWLIQICDMTHFI